MKKIHHNRSFSCKIFLKQKFHEKRVMMNLQNDSTKMNPLLQEHLNIWDKKILPHLPKQLDELAAQTGAVQRKRGIRSAQDLLKILFLYACSDFSFRILATAACALGISGVSDTAWRKRFLKAVPFLHEILHRMLSSLFTPSDTLFTGVKNVLLVDASTVRQQGADENQQRIHLCYSLNQNRIKQVKVTDHHTAESLTHFSMGKGDLIMADAGYGTARNYIYAQEQQADVILRITPRNFCLYDADGEKISLVSLLKKAEEQNQEMIDVFGFCRYRNKTGYVRVIAQKLPEHQAQKARKRKKRKACKNQNQITEDTLFCAGYMVVITSLGAEYSGEEILNLYRSRWQVELLFKRVKQSFSITTIKAGNTNYAEALVLLQLILWIIAEHQSFLCERILKEKTERMETIYSTYENCMIAFIQIKTILCLPWGLFIDLADEKYFRYLSKQKRWRINQNEAFHTAILPGLLS